jgi:mono/diheme cytochrome c family protein
MTMKKILRKTAQWTGVGLAVSSLSIAGGCRGQKSKSPPIHPNLNMDFQTSLKAQEEAPFFEDGRAMRPDVLGTVARGSLNGSAEFRTGRSGEDYVTESPVPITQALLARGKERYGIYCTPCHGGAGYADGIVTTRGNVPPPSFHDPRLREMPVGQIYEAIEKGVRNMPAYGYRIEGTDRWAIVAYVRALQLSQSASVDDVPAEISREKGWK